MAKIIKKNSNFLLWVFLPSLLFVVSVFGIHLISTPGLGQGAPVCSVPADCNSMDTNPCRQFDCVNSLCQETGINLGNSLCGLCGQCGNGVCEPSLGEDSLCNGVGQDCTSPATGAICASTVPCGGATRDFCCPNNCSGDPQNANSFDIDCACCGDSLPGIGELCDPAGSTCTVPGGTTGGGTCNAQCQCASNCGDGNLDAGEQCDPPNGTTCDANCQTIAPICGNGVLDPGEDCEGTTCNFTNTDGTIIPGACVACQCLPECRSEGSGCGDDGTSGSGVCFSGTGGTTGGVSLIPVGVQAGVLAQWLAAFAIPGAAFVGLKVRRRFKK